MTDCATPMEEGIRLCTNMGVEETNIPLYHSICGKYYLPNKHLPKYCLCRDCVNMYMAASKKSLVQKNKRCALVRTKNLKWQQIKQQYKYRNFDFLYSMFTNHHICVVLLYSVHHIGHWNSPNFMHKSKHTYIEVLNPKKIKNRANKPWFFLN